VGSAYNTIIPLAGLGGEPWKVKHLSQWMDYEEASRTSVQDRLIHSQSGIIFSAITLILTLNFVTFPADFAYLIMPLQIAAVVLSCIGLAMMWLTLSKFPSFIAAYILKKLKLADDFQMETLPPARFFGSLFFKLCARFLNLVEIFAIFTILGITPEFIHLIMVASFISVSAVVGFYIPQGMGVNEIGIAGALTILGEAAALGFLFGLIRRARMIFWAMLGIGLHLVVAFYKKASLDWGLIRNRS